MNHPRKDLLNISSLTDEEIHTLLDSAGPMKELFTKSVKKGARPERQVRSDAFL